MNSQKLFLVPIILMTAIGLAGCADLSLRKGISPALDAGAVETAAMNQSRIIDALARDAGFDHPQDTESVNYYEVAVTGFNYVDDQCRAYFDEMFFIDRGRSQIKSGLAAAGATTAAVLGLTSASTLSMAVVASAFGFASNSTDIITGTYLYALPPATTQALVAKLQMKYRDEAAQRKLDIGSRAESYHQIQNYLALCLPPTIEAEIENAVNGAKPTVVRGAKTFSVVAAPPPAEPKAGPPPKAPPSGHASADLTRVTAACKVVAEDERVLSALSAQLNDPSIAAEAKAEIAKAQQKLERDQNARSALLKQAGLASCPG